MKEDQQIHPYRQVGLPARTALQNAASVSSLLVTTEATISDAPDDGGSAPAGGGMPAGMPGMGGMGGMGGMM